MKKRIDNLKVTPSTTELALTGELHILWYLVGLIAADGSLSKDGRHIDITSKDRQMILDIIDKAGLNNKIGIKKSGYGTISYRVQISNTNFYNFLLSIGLMPAKSLKLGEISVPCEYFTEFLRGIIDGDGSIKRWIHPTNGCEQWSLRIYSGSQCFVNWLGAEIKKAIGVSGKVHLNSGRKNPNRVYALKFGKLAAKAILKKCYQKDSFGLERKARLADECVSSSIRWQKSKTVENVPG